MPLRKTPACPSRRFTSRMSPRRPAFTSHITRHAAGKNGLPETMGSGAAFFDADGDGWPDILLINGKDLDAAWPHILTAALYRNNHDGLSPTSRPAGSRCRDVRDRRRRSAIMITMAAMTSTLRRSKAIICSTTKATEIFATSPRESGIAQCAFGTSAAWLDYDRDGKLDLFVANYVQWTPAKRSMVLARWRDEILLHARILQRHLVQALSQSGRRQIRRCHSRKPASPTPRSKSLGVTVFDYNGDGWPDIFVANDTQPNKLYRNLQERHV